MEYNIWNVEGLNKQLQKIKKQFGKNLNCDVLEKWIGILKKFLLYEGKVLLETKYEEKKFYTEEEVSQFLKENFVCKETTVTAAIIVKNEERVIARCLNSILNQFDRIVIVDTGSGDKTLDIIKDIKSEKVQLYETEWKENFARARNFALSKVETEWVFFIDADEVLTEMEYSIKEILSVCNKFDFVHNLTLSPKIVDVEKNGYIGVRRIFRKDSGIEYYGLVHEEARKIINGEIVALNNICVDIPIEHDGYKNEVVEKKNKVDRNLSLLEKMRVIEPENVRWAYFYMRDGLEKISIEEINSIFSKHLLLDREKGIASGNIKKDQYTFSFLVLYVQFQICHEKYDDLNFAFECLEEINKDNNDIMYLKTYVEMCLLKKQWNQLLKKLVEYRNEHLETQYGTMHSEGLHLDCLIGILLFETGHINKAVSYFKYVGEIERFKPLVNYYYNMMSECKKYSLE